MVFFESFYTVKPFFFSWTIEPMINVFVSPTQPFYSQEQLLNKLKIILQKTFDQTYLFFVFLC